VSERKKNKIPTLGCLSVLIIIPIVFILSLLILKFLWAWVIPDIFPGAVKQGLIVATLTWWQSFKLSIFISIVIGGLSFRKSSE